YISPRYIFATLHLVDRVDPKHLQTRGNDQRDRTHQSEACARQLWIPPDEETQRRLVLALGPQQMELRRDILKKKGDAVRLMRLGGGLDDARPAREQANQRQFERIFETRERRVRERCIGQFLARQ